MRSLLAQLTTHNSQLTTAFLVLSCLLLIPGCAYNDEEVSACVAQGAFEGPIVVDVVCAQPQTQPRYVWDADKSVVSLEVRRTLGDQALAWSVFSGTQQNEIIPPVQHGNTQTLPIGIIKSGGETELEIGVEYQVTLSQISEGGLPSGSGSRKFTIQP